MMVHVLMMILLVYSAVSFYYTNTVNPGQLTDAHPNIAVWKKLYEQTLEAFAKDGDESAIPQLCHTCHIARPPRSKHDRYTHACVLLFDHHCPFVGNTVGLYNYKYFYQFLVGITLYLIGHSILLGIYCSRQPTTPVVTLVIGIFLSAQCFLSGGMLIYHTQLLYVNLTTNEHLNLKRYDYFWESADGGKRFHNPWNRGCYWNFVDRWNPSDASFLVQDPQYQSLLRNEPSGASSLESADHNIV
jgi:hypothetical protein